MTASNLTPRKQRIVAMAAVVVWVLAWVATQANPARADDPIGSSCGPNDSQRAHLTAYHGSRSLNPCISGTNLRLDIPRGPLNPACICYPRRFNVQEIRRIGQEDVQIGDKLVKLWHFSFKRFQIVDHGTINTTDGPGYTLSIKPKDFAQIGGANDSGTAMYTDLWIDKGTFSIAPLFGGIDIPEDSPLIEVVQGLDLVGTRLQLDIKYLVTYSDAPSDKGNFPVRLPNTELSIS
ncbi:hypothetical protein [Luteipulveratus mongoliensis]|uniref:Uncharacterized protein n=1 Tax=Luteipulveratus mongoliensis TaxID=571913 RepID=A0A0K1JE95_9MICO|nr:hypothetical protein [Luteipulveratus mongoliensis]AKU14910.1 hypothetical protein VV02_01915 [Luteipulveratus mongoliensis]